ncbi:MAG: YihY/virulence factor BrkB family protein [Cyclobacteriaceae bacterium]|nr:YihY/virulence factor BrkB family protein [Cyclobacteriaceae bacterium]
MNKASRNNIKKIISFFTHEIWNIDLSNKPKLPKFFYQSIKVIILALKGGKEDKVMLRASALTFFSLLSIVPVLAMAFGLAKGFGLDKLLEQQLLENFQGQEEIFIQSLDFAKNMLDSTKGGLIAGIGLIFLFYSVMKLLNNIEASFNDIWYIHKQRNITRKFTDYITIMLFAPILMVLSNSLTVFIASKIEYLTNTVDFIALFKGLIFPLLKLLPYTVLWLLFTLIYMIMPNTKVKPKSAIIAGVVAGTLFQLLQVLLLKFEVNVSKYNAIYGSFAALPLFLIWLQSSWIIVLYGSEISYSIQNVNNYESNMRAEGFSMKFKKKVALATSLVIIKNFKEGMPALSIEDIIEKIKVPNKMLQEVLDSLIGCNIIAETSKDDDNRRYQPAIDTDILTVHFILSKFENYGNSTVGNHIDDNNTIALANEILHGIDKIIEGSELNKLLKTV